MKRRRVAREQLLVDVLAHVQPHQDLLHVAGHAGLVQGRRHPRQIKKLFFSITFIEKGRKLCSGLFLVPAFFAAR